MIHVAMARLKGKGRVAEEAESEESSRRQVSSYHRQNEVLAHLLIVFCCYKADATTDYPILSDLQINHAKESTSQGAGVR